MVEHEAAALAIGGVVFFCSIFFSLAPSGGWFMDPPLSDGVYSKGSRAARRADPGLLLPRLLPWGGV